MRDQFPTNKIITTGHSLGGSQAIYVADKYNLESYTFNPGGSPLDILRHSLGSSNAKHTIFTTRQTGKDLVSLFAVTAGKENKIVNVVPDTTKNSEETLSEFGVPNTQFNNPIQYHSLEFFRNPRFLTKEFKNDRKERENRKEREVYTPSNIPRFTFLCDKYPNSFLCRD